MSTEAPKGSLTYLEDMADCISKIFTYTEGLSLEQFCEDRKTVDSVCFNLAVLGEAANKVSPETQQEMKNIPWRKIISAKVWAPIHDLDHLYCNAMVKAIVSRPKDVLFDQLPTSST